MYGGHITDDWDRRLCNAYLEELMQPDLVRNPFEIITINKAFPRYYLTSYTKCVH